VERKKEAALQQVELKVGWDNGGRKGKFSVQGIRWTMLMVRKGCKTEAAAGQVMVVLGLQLTGRE